jgi:hypothetical protein
MKTEIFIHESPVIDTEALRQSLAAAGLSLHPGKVVVLKACLAALWKSYRQNCTPLDASGKPRHGIYRPGKRRPAPETTFGVELYDVYRNLGGAAVIRSRAFYDFAHACAAAVEIQIGPRENFKMKMRRVTNHKIENAPPAP